jgi:soluble lytic murein transglycosylase-like protein
MAEQIPAREQESGNEGDSRREVNRKLLYAIVAAMMPIDRASGQQSDAIERGRALLRSLVANPAWEIPPSDASESARMFYAAHEAHRRYYSGSQGASLLRAGLRRLLEDDGRQLKLALGLAQKYGVPKEIICLGLAESHWYPFGENRAKAAGIWQIVPGTAVMLGLQNVPFGAQRTKERYTRDELVSLNDERLDPEKSTDAAMRYLVSLKRFFQRIATKHSFPVTERDIWSFAMWAYNRGPGHVRQTFIDTKGVPLQYPLALTNQAVPATANASVVTASRRESINYVPKILAIRDVVRALATGTAPIAEQPSKKGSPKASDPVVRPKSVVPPEHGPSREPDAAREPEEVVELIEYRVQGGDNLTKIATWISSDPDFVELRMDQIREYNERTQQRRLRDQFNKDEKVFIPAQRILVQSGDTLDKFARTYCSGWPVPVAVNHLRLMGFGPARSFRRIGASSFHCRITDVFQSRSCSRAP